MKKVTGVLITLITIAGFNHTATAQVADTPTPGRQAERMTDVMAERLELNDQQKQKVLVLNRGLAKKKEDLLENEELDYWDRMEKVKEIPATRAEKLQSILNDQQYLKYQTLKNRKRQDNQ